MFPTCAAPLTALSFAVPNRAPLRLRGGRGCAISALALGAALSANPALANCFAVVTATTDYPCIGALDETLDAGDGSNLVYSGATTGNLTVNGQAGADAIIFDGSILAAHTGTTIADGGDDADQITVQGASLLTGTILGGSGADALLVEGSATLTGGLDGGTGNDSLIVRAFGTVTADVLGGTGADSIVTSGGASVGGDLDAGDDNDLVTVQGTSTVAGDVLGGEGVDSLLVEGNATVTGALSGGDGADVIRVTGGAVQGGVSGGNGNDLADLRGGSIGGLVGTDLLDMGTGDDTLVLTFSAGEDAIDLASVAGFDGGTGADAGVIEGFDGDYSEGGLFDRTFTGWETLDAVGTNLQFATTATISGLTLSGASLLFQTDGALALLDAGGADAARLSLDGTSGIDMRDSAFAAALPLSFAPQSLAFPTGFLPPLPASVADDSITVATLALTGSADPLGLPTLRVDLDADTTVFQNARDDADSGNADQIDVGTGITTGGVIGVQINAVGGYLGTGAPVGLSGSVGIVDDLTASALSRPGINATLVASSTYVATSNLPVDPGRQWALVDQGNGGVYLQWTTLINATTTGPEAAAELAVAQGGTETMSDILSGLSDDTISKRDLCASADKHKGWCDLAPVSVWVMAGGSRTETGAVGGFAGSDSTTRQLTGGIEYAPAEGWTAGLFASLQQGTADLGSIDGAFGPRASGAEFSSGYLGAYVETEQNGAYFTGVAAVGKAQTDLVNGVLFGATSGHDSFVGMIGATAGKRMAIGDNGFGIDPRIEASYALSDGKTHSDSAGLLLTPSAEQARLAATVGLTYHPDQSPLTLTMRAGTAFLVSDSAVETAEAAGGSAFATDAHRMDKVFTGSVQGRWMFSESAALVGSVSADTGDDFSRTRGAVTFTYAF